MFVWGEPIPRFWCLGSHFQKEIDALKKKHEDELRQVKQQMEAKHKAEIDALKKKHQQEVAKLQGEQDRLKQKVGSM